MLFQVEAVILAFFSMLNFSDAKNNQISAEVRNTAFKVTKDMLDQMVPQLGKLP
jgi:hypothetical protein